MVPAVLAQFGRCDDLGVLAAGELRLAAGLPLDALDDQAVNQARVAVSDGLLESAALAAGRCVLTRRGQPLADAVVRRLT